MMDCKTCRFDGCRLMYKNLYELIHHIEEDHIPDIEKKKLQELEDQKHPKLADPSNNGEGNEGDVNPPNQTQERLQQQTNPFSQSIPLSLLCKLRPFPKGHKVFPISPKKVTMNFCQYRKRPLVNDSSSNELMTSPQHIQQMHSTQFGSSIPFGSFQAPNAKRPARRISEISSDSGFSKDVKPSIPAGSILAVDERRYRCDVEGCKKAYKNTQGLRAHIRNTHNLTGSSPRLSPSEEGILSRQLPSTNLVQSPLTTGLSSSAQQPVETDVGNRADDGEQEVVMENVGYVAANNTTAQIQQRQVVQQQQQPMATLGAHRIQQQQQQRSYTTSKYPCQHCPKTYKTIMNLNKHMQESHPKQMAHTTVGQLISPIRSHSPRTLPGHSLVQKQIHSSPSALARTQTSSLVHPKGPSPTPMSSSTSQILVRSGGQEPQSPAHASGLSTLVPASPQHIAHVQQSSGYGAQQQQQHQPNQQQQYYVTTNTGGQVVHQQNHSSRGYSYQQEHQYTSNSGQHQVQPPPYSSSTSSPVQGTTIYVSQQQQQQSPIQLQQYTQPSAFTQHQPRGVSAGQQPGANIIHHRVHHSQQQHVYPSAGQQQQQQGGRQQPQYQQRLVATGGQQQAQTQQQQQPSSNATTIRVSSLNPYHGQQQYVQVQQQQPSAVLGSPVSQQQQQMVQAVAVSQPSYASQQQMPSSHTPSSFVVRTSNHNYVKQSQQPFPNNNSTSQPTQQQRYNPASASSNSQQQAQTNCSAPLSRGGNSSPSTQQYTQSSGNYAPPPPQYNRAVAGGQQVLRSVSPGNVSANTPGTGPQSVRMLAASGHNYAAQYGSSTQQQYQNIQQYPGPRARAPPSRMVSNVVQQSGGEGGQGQGQSYSGTAQQIVRSGRVYEQGTRNYYSGGPGGAQGYRDRTGTYANPSPSNSSNGLNAEPVGNKSEPAIAPTLQPQEPVKES